MPTYEYRCDNPEDPIPGPAFEFEKNVPIDERDQVRCPECGGPAKRQIAKGVLHTFFGGVGL